MVEDQPKFPGGGDEAEEPDVPAPDEEYSFNLGMYRIETLHKLLVACARAYKKAISKREERYVHKYQDIVNTLYTETYIYMENETGFTKMDVPQDKDEVLKQVLDDRRNYSGEEDMLEHIQQIRGIYLEVRRLMQQVKLDIPKKDKIGDTDIFQKG